MEINLFVNDDGRNSNIIDFCMQSKRLKFVFQKLSNIKLLYHQKKLVIIKEDFSINDLKKRLEKDFYFFSKNTCFFISEKHKNTNLNINAAFIYYPVSFIDFENTLLNVFKIQKPQFKNLELRNDNTLYNHDNKKQTYLTEIESKIVLLLFSNDDFIDKKTLNKKVLNQSPLIDSKSLDSHLYRLRKKLISVDSKRKILLTANQGMKII